MTRDEFRKCAHEMRIALGHNYMEQLEEMESAYERCTRSNERLRAELEEMREAMQKSYEQGVESAQRPGRGI